MDDMIDIREVQLVDDDGQVRVSVGFHPEKSGLWIRDKDGRTRFVTSVRKDESHLELLDKNDQVVWSLEDAAE